MNTIRPLLLKLLFALLAAVLLTSCATNSAYVDPEPQRNANQHLQDAQQRRALSGMSHL